MLIKMNVQKETSFSQNLELFLDPFTLKQKVISWHIFIEDLIAKHNSKSSLFQEKNNSQGVARFQKQIVLNSHRNNFCFQNARSRFQDLF